MQFASTWTDERIETLKTLAADGKSCSTIAAEMDVSRNAVIGKAHRLGLQLKHRPFSERAAEARKPRAKRIRQCKNPPPMLVEKDKVVPAYPGALNLRLQQLGGILKEGMQCRYVTEGEGESARFCGCRTVSGSWCSFHEVAVFTPDSLAKVRGAVGCR